MKTGWNFVPSNSFRLSVHNLLFQYTKYTSRADVHIPEQLPTAYMAILMLERNVNTLAQSSLNAHWTSGGSSHQ